MKKTAIIGLVVVVLSLGASFWLPVTQALHPRALKLKTRQKKRKPRTSARKIRWRSFALRSKSSRDWRPIRPRS